MEHKTTIDGITYKTHTLPTSRGLVVFPKLLALFGEPVLKLFFVAGGDEERKSLLKQPQVLGSILSRVAENAAENDGLLVLRDLFEKTTADKVKIGDAEVEDSVHAHFDTHFQARYGHLLHVSMWVATVNFTGL